MRWVGYVILLLASLFTTVVYAEKNMSCTDVGITASNMYLAYWKGEQIHHIVEDNLSGKSFRDKEIVHLIGGVLERLDPDIPKSELRAQRNSLKNTLKRYCLNGEFD